MRCGFDSRGGGCFVPNRILRDSHHSRDAQHLSSQRLACHLSATQISDENGMIELTSCRKRSGRELWTRQRCSPRCVAVSHTAVAADPTSHPPARPYRHSYLLTSVGTLSHLFRLILLFGFVASIHTAVGMPHMDLKWAHCVLRAGCKRESESCRGSGG